MTTQNTFLDTMKDNVILQRVGQSTVNSGQEEVVSQEVYLNFHHFCG